MNRAQRRAAARSARRGSDHGHGLACGCTPRVLEPVGSTDCPACGTPSPYDGAVVMPVLAPVGSLLDVGAVCICGHEWAVACFVS